MNSAILSKLNEQKKDPVSMIIIEELLRETNGRGEVVEVIRGEKLTTDPDELFDWLDFVIREKLKYSLRTPFDDTYLELSAEGALEYLQN